MLFRNFVCTALLALALLGGGRVSAGAEAAKNGAGPILAEAHRLADSAAAAAELSDWPGQVRKRVFAYAEIVRSHKELWLYGALAGLGILIALLAIGNARSTPKNSATQIMEILRHEKEKAEQLATLKSEFLNQVSHELRTPLAVILGYLECMTDGLYGEIEAKHREILQTVAKQSSHLKNMIDQILIYSRLESSKQPLRVQEFSVQKLFSDLSESFDFLCRQKGLEIVWQVPSDLPILRSDAEKLKEVLSNLLQNALKYTDSGSIRVWLAHESASDLFVFKVADTGLGIPEHHLSAIFEPFIQVHKTSTGNARGGIGLGLSIVKKHVEQLKGTIRVESQVGRGTTFIITLPQLQEAAALQRWRPLQRLKASWPSFMRRSNLDARSPAERAKSNLRDLPPPPRQAVG